MSNWAMDRLQHLECEYGDFFNFCKDNQDDSSIKGSEKLWGYYSIYSFVKSALTEVINIDHPLIRRALNNEIPNDLLELDYIKSCFQSEFRNYQEYKSKVSPVSSPSINVEELARQLGVTVVMGMEIKGDVQASDETGFDAGEVIGKLEAFESEAEADKYLCELNLKKSQYKTLVDHCGVWIPAYASKKEIRTRLVDYCVGTRLRSNVIRNVDVSHTPRPKTEGVES